MLNEWMIDEVNSRHANLFLSGFAHSYLVHAPPMASSRKFSFQKCFRYGPGFIHTDYSGAKDQDIRVIVFPGKLRYMNIPC